MKAVNLDELVERVKGHTAGSWRAVILEDQLYVESSEGHILIADVGGVKVMDISDTPHANAALIAAAPSLLTLALEQAEEIKRLKAELERRP